MATLQLEQVEKHYGPVTVVSGIDLEVREGELVSLLGPSGCGKTTTLRMVAGFIQPNSGKIVIGGREVTHTPPFARNTGMVFQSYALFPHMSVASNVSFGLEMRRIGKADREKRVIEALRLVKLDHLAERYPRELSGGQQQRVALARALVVNPQVFLLDEPLSNLDAKLRAHVRDEIRELQQRLGLTTLFVTHDQDEALAMSDRLVVLDGGKVQQIGTAEDLYERPANAFVASFVGHCNLLGGVSREPGRFLLDNGIEVPCRPQPPNVDRGLLALRPERVRLGTPGEAGVVTALLKSATYLGSQTEYRFDLAGVDILSKQPTPSSQDPLRRLARGDRVPLHWEASEALQLPAA